MNIVLLSRNAGLYSTHSLFTAARMRGHYVRVIDHMQCDLVIEKNKPQVIYRGERLRNINAVVPRIGTSATSYGAAVIRQFTMMGCYSTLDPTALINARDKMTCLQILSSNGIPVPKSLVSNDFTGYYDYTAEVGPLPIILKMINGTHGLGVVKGESEGNIESILELMSKTKQKMMMQKYIAESKGADIRVFIVDGEIVGSMKRQAKPGEFRSNLHRGGTSSIIHVSKKEANLALKAVEILGLSVAGVDMLQSHDGPLILEVNASPGLEGIETTTGVDIAGKIITMIEKNKIRY